MENNIYQIDNWAGNTAYYKNKILTNNNLYYYVAYNYVSSASITNDISNGNLNGYIYNYGQMKPYFIWKPSYKLSNENVPRVKKIQFGDGYAQYIPDGINTILLNYSFTFENRDLHEITAILHFLSTRNGVESFCFLPPAPRGQILRFICPKWSDVQEFYSNYTITAQFLQNPV